MEYTNTELGALLESIVQNMASKDDIKDMATKSDIKQMNQRIDGLEAEVRIGVREVRSDVRGLRSDMRTLTETVEGMKGYAKELDDHADRIHTLEQHPNLQPHTA